MRQLTKKQKELLGNFCETARLQATEIPMDIDSLPTDLVDRLYSINDTEILHQEVNRFLWDEKFKK